MSGNGTQAVLLAAGLPGFVSEAVTDALPRADVAVRTMAAAAVDRAVVLGTDCVVLGDDGGSVDVVDLLATVRDVRPDVPVALVPTEPEPRVASKAVAHDVDAYLPVTVIDAGNDVADAVVDAVCATDRPATDDGDGDPGATADGGRTAVPAPTAADPFEHRPGVPDEATGVLEAGVASRRLVELAPDPMFVADLDSQVVLSANQAAADILGYAPETLRGIHVTELHPGSAASIMERVAGIIDENRDEDPRFDAVDGLELRTRRGEHVPVAMRADTVGVDDRTLVAVVFRDVSDERDRIEALERTERRLRNVTDAAFDIVFRLDADGAFESVSGTVASVLGYEPGDLLGRSFSTVIADSDRDRALDAFARARDGERVSELPLSVVAADHRRRRIETNLVPVTVDGEVRGIEGAARDVTRQHQRERLLSVLNRVLRHNVRNAATLLRGHGDALANATDDPAVAPHVDAVRATTNDLVELGEKSAQLRRAARNRGAVTGVDAATAVSRAVDRSDATAAVLDVHGTDTVNAGGALEFAVQELIENAAEHADGVERVEVDVRERHVVVAAVDDGDGLPEQERRVLEGGDESPLEHGSGLGVWLVNWITSTGGGHVNVDASADRTRIELWLAKTDA